MNRLRVRIPAIVAAGCVGAAAASASNDLAVVHAVALMTALVVGELLVLRLEDGTGIPVAYAPLLVVVVGFTSTRVAVIVAAAVVIGAAVGTDRRGLRGRCTTSAQRLAVGAAALGAYQGMFVALGRTESVAVVLGSLVTAVVAMVVVEEMARQGQRLPSALTARGVRAWSALGATGVLMALGYRGVDGRGGTGLWSVALFSIPLIAAWYSFERLAVVTRTHRQTLQALSMATEMAGLVVDGHGRRVAELSERIAHEVGLDLSTIEHIVAAAHLHHLGVVTLDDPPAPRAPDRVAIVADVTAAMLREIPALTEAARIVDGQGRHARDLRGRADDRLASQVLKVASDFDDLAGDEPLRARPALEALYASPGYVYDRRVLEALEVALG